MKYIIIIIIFSVQYTLCVNFCEKITKLYPTEFSDVVGCISSVPFSEKVRDATIKNIEFLYKNFYVYQDIVTHPFAPYFIETDIEGLINEIKTKSFVNDYYFHKRVQEIFNTLFDAHTVYIPPLCYSGFLLYQPFLIEKRDDKIFIKAFTGKDKKIADEYSLLYPNFNVDDYIGQRIDAIENENPIQHILKYSKDFNFYSKDESVRFNKVLKDEWSRRSLTRNYLPSKSSIKYDLYDTKKNKSSTLTINWMGIPSLEYETTKMEELCGYFPEEEKKTEKKRKTINDLFTLVNNSNAQHIHEFLERRYINSPNKNNKRRNIEQEGPVVPNGYELLPFQYNDFEYFELYKKKNKAIAILKVKTFMPDIQVEDQERAVLSYSYWFLSLNEAFKTLKNNGITQLVLDMRGNSGGVLCFCHVLAKFVSKYIPKDPSPNGEILSNEITKLLHCENNVIDKMNNFNVDRKPVGADWVENGVFRNRGKAGSKGMYFSQMIHAGCQIPLFIGGVDYFWEDPPIQFEPENLILFTDGTCGSACGVFVKLFQHLNLARIVSQGGIDNKNMSICSFKGAAVKDLNGTKTEMDMYKFLCGLEDIDLDYFPSNAIFTYGWYQLYPIIPKISIFELDKQDDSIPSDFLRQAADFHIKSWDFSENVYDKVLPFFDKCAPWEIKKSEYCDQVIKHGVYGNPCNPTTGQFDTNICELRGCVGGYYLSEDKSVCKVMPDYYDTLGDWRSAIIQVIFGMFLVAIFFNCCFLCCGITCCGITCWCIKVPNEEKILPKKELVENKYNELPSEEEEEEEENV